jgi:asparagine synthase (glutamine-hydrolysing)
MCGYFAFISSKNKQYPEKRFNSAFKLLSHRGPDFSKVLYGKKNNFSYQLGHHRLSIRDISDNANQPFLSECENYILLFNGEIYNITELRNFIKRKIFKTTSDTEILLYFLIENRKSFELINGIYSFIFIDLKLEKVIISRDPLGVKPIYYAKANDGVLFSSEPKAIVQLESSLKKISSKSVVNLINYGYVGYQNSFFKNIKPISPGQTIEYFKDDLKVINNIDLNFQNNKPAQRQTLSQEDLEKEIKKTINTQTVSDVPVCVWQSGGIDSTIINYTLRNQKIKNFTLKFHGKNFDESFLAKSISDSLNRDFEEINWPNQLDIEKNFKKMIWHVDGEIADSSAIASLILSEKTSNFSKVVLSGDGGDEIFGGYLTYNATLFANYLKFLPKDICQMISNIFAKLQQHETRYSFFEFLSRFFSYCYFGVDAHSQWRRYSNLDLSKKLFINECSVLNEEEIIFNKVKKYYRNLNHINSIKAKSQAIDLKFYLPSDMLIKLDRMTMAYGLEARVPFLDFDLLRKLFALGRENYNSNLFSTKPLLRKMAKNLGVPSTIYEKKKTGFNINVDYCIDQLRNHQKKLFNNFEVFEEHFDIDTIKNVIHEHENKKLNHGYLIWTLMCFAQTRINFNI